MCRTLTVVHEIDNIEPFGRPQSGTVIIQLMTELDVSNNQIPKQQYQNRQESKAFALFFFFFSIKNRTSQCTYFVNI